MSVIHAPEKPEIDGRHLLLLIGVGIGLGAVAIKLWYLQVVRSEELTDAAQRTLRSSVSTVAPRGLIYDRNGQLIAGVQPKTVITAIPATVRKQKWVMAKLAQMIGEDENKLWEKLKDGVWRPYLPTPISSGVPIDLASKIAESNSDLPGIDVATQPMRFYPDSRSLSHVLGYVWTPSGADVERISKDLSTTNLKPAPYVGKDGLERTYETRLMGVPGKEELEVDSKRRPVRVVGRTPGVPGERLYLTIDLELQKYANAVLEQYRNKAENAGGAIVAMDMEGGILAMASAPNFDTTSFIGGISKSEYEALNSKQFGQPLLNRATSGVYSPGSTFKIVTTLAAVKAGIFDPRKTTYCRGYYDLGSKRPKCMGTHGPIAFHEAMVKSCNAYFMDLGVRSGIENIRKAALELGLEQKSGIDLPSEARGSIPTEDWLRRRRNLGPDQTPVWYRGDTANVSIGQGDVQTSPLQMALIAQTVANNGRQYPPHFLSAIGVEDKVTRESITPKDIESSSIVWTELRSALVDVVGRGTARKAQIQGINWGGKTGSTEHSRRGNTHSWFVGFAPAENPKVAIAVLFERVGHGGDFAAPAAGLIVKRYLESLSKPKP